MSVGQDFLTAINQSDNIGKDFLTVINQDDKVGEDFLTVINQDIPKEKPGLTFSKMAESVKKSPPKEGESPEDKENLLFRTLDNVNRAQYGVANTIYQAVIKGDREYAKTYWDGLSLKEKKSIGNTLSEIIQPDSKFGKAAVAVAGFAGDVLTDPLTYVGAGLISRSGKLVKGGTSASKALKAERAASKGTGLFKGAEDSQAVFTLVGKKIPGSGYVAEPIAKGLGKAGKVIREDLGPISEVIDKLKYVSTKFRPKGVDPVEWNKYLTASTKAKNIQRSAEFTTLEKSKSIHKAFKDEGLDDDAISKITNAIETKGEVTSKGGILAKEARDEFQSTYQKVGPTGKQVIGEDGYEYLPHVSVKKNDKLQNAIGVKAREFTTKSPSDIKRTILKYTDESGEEFVVSTKTGKVFQDGKHVMSLRKKDLDVINSIDEMEGFINKSFPKFEQEGLITRKGLININEAKQAFKNTEIPELLKFAQLQQLSKMYKENPNKIKELLTEVKGEKLLTDSIAKTKTPYKKFSTTKLDKNLIDKEQVLKAIDDSGIENMLNKYQSTLLRKGRSPRIKKTPLVSPQNVDAFKLLDVDGKLTKILKDTSRLGLNKILNSIDYVESPSLLGIMKGKTEGLRKTYGQLSQASIADINKAYGDTVFSAKLPELIAIQGMRTAKVVGGDELFKNVSQFASKTPKTVKGVDYIESTAPELAGKYFHPEIVKHIDSTRQKLVNPEEINEALKLFETTQNMWKSTATYWNVAFHTRNTISNVWQNSIAGVNNPLDYAKASKIQFGLRKGVQSLAPDEQKIVKEYREQGLSRVGHLSGDISQSIESEIMSTMDLLKKKKPAQVLNKIGGAAGDAIEGNAKLAHFIAKRKEGLSAFDAGESVKKYLFDYEDLTKVEKEVFKRAMPFYTFTRKNIPVQLETLIKNPVRQSKLIKAKNNVEILTGDDKTQHILPEWLKDSAPVYVGNKDGKVRYIKLEGFLPVADLNKFSGGAQELLNMVSPVIKVPTEQLANYNFFFGKKITKHKGLKEGFTGRGEKDLLWGKVPARIDHLARLFRPINEIDKIIGKKYKGNSGLSKAMNLVLGGKVYEYETRELLNKFNRLSDEEARNIKSEINWLKKEIRRNPELRDENREEIKNLYDLYKKSKIISQKRKRKAREALR